VKEHGEAARDAIKLMLFHGLEMQELAEAGTTHPPLKETRDSRAILIQAYGADPTVKSGDKPYVRTWAIDEEAGFIEVMFRNQNPKINSAVHAIFLANQQREDLAMACVKQLSGKGYDDELRAYCERKGKESNDEQEKARWKAALDAIKRQ
jgi:hypothetical protein